MPKNLFTPSWRKASVAVVIVLLAASVWARWNVAASRLEASSATIAPMDMMAKPGKALPVADHVEPF